MYRIKTAQLRVWRHTIIRLLLLNEWFFVEVVISSYHKGRDEMTKHHKTYNVNYKFNKRKKNNPQ